MKNNYLAGDFPSLYYDTLPHCPNARHEARSYTNLSIKVVQMEFNGFLANENFGGNRFVSVASKN